MRTVACIALFLFAHTSPGQSIEFRILERFGDTSVGPGDSAPTGSPLDAGDPSDRTLWFVVQARVSGLNPAAFNGLASFAGDILVTSGAGSGTFKVGGTGGFPAGSPSNRSPVNYLPAGTSDNGFSTLGRALYPPFRLVSDFNSLNDGSVVGGNHNGLRSIVGATGGSALDRLSDGELDTAVWGVNAWTNVYAFQYDVLSFSSQELTFTTNFFDTNYFNERDIFGVPNSIPILNRTQASFSVLIPTPRGAAVLALGGLMAARRRR